MRPIALNVLAGVGGFALGVEQAGFNVVAALEPDRLAASILSYNAPLLAISTHNVRGISPSRVGKTLREGLGRFAHHPQSEVDLVFGGPLPVTNALGQPPEEHHRDMLMAFVRAAMFVKPKLVLLALETATLPAEPDLQAFFLALGEHGYAARPAAHFNTALFGVPQERDFTLILAARADVALPAYPQATTSPEDSVSLDLFQTTPRGPTVHGAIGDLAVFEKAVDLTNLDRLTLTPADLARFELEVQGYARGLRCRVDGDFSYERVWEPAYLTNVRTETPAIDTLLRYSRTSAGAREPVSDLVRLDPRDVAPSIGPNFRGAAYTRLIHPTFPRLISVREAARLQSYPDWFRFHESPEHGFMQVASSIPPRFAREIGAGLLQHLGLDAEVPTRILTRRNLPMFSTAA